MYLIKFLCILTAILSSMLLMGCGGSGGGGINDDLNQQSDVTEGVTYLSSLQVLSVESISPSINMAMLEAKNSAFATCKPVANALCRLRWY